MRLDSDIIEELGLLKRFSMGGPLAMDLSDSPDEDIVAAAERMFEKGLITQADGGELTDAGREAIEHMDRLFNLLTPPLEPI
tara:strand:- start:46 stop:291 length:246 start_codon:yes stop_codon:yes gene_type:complete